MPSHNKVRVTFETTLPAGATFSMLKEFIHDLEWVGGCRNPDHDPFFNSIKISALQVVRVK